MKAIVCVKQVPDTQGKVAVKADGTMDRAAMATITNPDDLNAVEAALQLKDETGCEVVVVTMGPPPAEGMLRELMARGADRGVLVSGREFGGSDTFATSQILAAAVNKIGVGPEDIVFCGRQAIDGDTAQVGPQIAEKLHLPQVTYAADIQKETVIGSKTYYVGKLNGEDVVLVQAGVGKVLSANYTAALLNNFTVKGVVFTGIAGGVGDDVNVMDMVIGTSLVQHDYGTETNNGFVWNGEAGSNQETGMIPVDGTLSKIAYNAACDVLGSAKVHQGVIATGDQFISSESYVKELQTKFDALACEMEGASVARVCDQFGMPCAILRCMSDKADGIAHDTYAFNYTEASNTSASVVQEMMKTLSTTLPFTDVKNTDWCFSEVARVYADGIMGGTSNTTFSPDADCTRAQIVTFLWRCKK